jgi:hypothetical protein
MTGSNASHEQHACAVIVLQIVDIGLKALGIADANASACTRFGFDETARIGLGVKRWMGSDDDRIFGIRLADVKVPPRCRVEQATVFDMIAVGRRRNCLRVKVRNICRQQDEHTEDGHHGALLRSCQAKRRLRFYMATK